MTAGYFNEKAFGVMFSDKFNVKAGITGTSVLQRDEMRALEQDSIFITLLALFGIFILFIVSFRMWVSPLLAIISVVIGVVWALGVSSFLIDYLMSQKQKTYYP